MQDDVASKIEAIATRVAASEGMEVVEVAVKGGGASRLIRISIDKPEGRYPRRLRAGFAAGGHDSGCRGCGAGWPLHAGGQLSRSGAQARQTRRFCALPGQEDQSGVAPADGGRRNWEGMLAGFEDAT